MIALAITLAVLSGSPQTTTKATQKKTQLRIEVKPESAVIYVDGKRKGTGAKVHTLTVQPGRHMIKVVHKKDEHAEPVMVKKGELTHWKWEFEDDRERRKEAEERRKEEEAAESASPPEEEFSDPDLR